MEYDSLTLFSLIVASICLFSWILLNSSKSPTGRQRRPPLPPGPRGLPILGYLPFLKENLHHQFTQLAHRYGPIYSLYLGSKLCVVISSPSLVKQVVRDHDPVFANRDPPVSALVATGGHDIVWTENGPYWRDMRKLFVREIMSNTNLKNSYVFRREEVRKLVEDLNTRIGSCVEIGELIFVTELHVLMSLLWGGEIDPVERSRLGAEFRVGILKFVELLGRVNVSDFFPGLTKFDFQGIAKEMRDVVRGVEEILDAFIDAKLKVMAGGEGEERRRDFLGVLLELKGKQLGESSTFGLTQVKAILMDIIVGGTDTTSTIVEWVMAELLNNPNVMQKVQKEIANVVGANNVVEESHLSKLSYLNAVIKETFRLHPPLPLLVPRHPSQSCTIGDYTIPKGTRVFLNMWSIYMDPRVWDNPLKFQPERFTNDNNNIGEKFDYIGNCYEFLPFGSGRRVCPGIPLAEKMVMYLLATLVHLFDWRLPEGQTIDLSEKFGIVTKKRTPLIAVPYHRYMTNTNMHA